MPTHKTKPTYIDAMQFDGTNGLEIQGIVGNHAVDAVGQYMVPNFDYASTWLPVVPDLVVAVLWTDSGWVGVKIGDWLMRDGDGKLTVCSNEEFSGKYEVNK